MRKTIKTEDLRIGMYIVLPVSWFKHPFLTNEFVLRSKEQIDKIIDYGIKEIVIDTSREEREKTEDPANTPPKTWTPEKLVPQELREAIHDKKLPPREKSKIVYESSRVLVQRLFEDPKTENIQAAK